MTEPKIAVFIDAENCTLKYLPDILKKISRLGRMTSCRAYGNWRCDRLKNAYETCLELGVVPQDIAELCAGKNASDIAIATDAATMVSQFAPDSICIVSSDSDFTYLVRFLRQRNVFLYGIGEKEKINPNTPKAYDEFFFVEDLLAGVKVAADAKAWQEQCEFVAMARCAVKKCYLAKYDNWAYIGDVGTALAEMPNYKSLRKKYGCRHFSKLLDNLGVFEMKRQGSEVYIRQIDFSPFVKDLDNALAKTTGWASIHTIATALESQFPKKTQTQLAYILASITNPNFEFSADRLEVKKTV